jgi:aryl-alcohol dehydrogenase-like predicted oxidoreductase
MKNGKQNRRTFIRNTSVSFLGAGMLTNHNGINALSLKQEEELPRIKEYRTLGRTGFKVSDIGTGFPFSEPVLRAVLDMGVNFIETSEMYGRGQNEILIGNVIKNHDRESLFILTKVAPTMREFESVDDILERTNKSLERLQTDYVDCLLIHGAENSKRVKDEYFHKAVDILRKQGKIKSTGISCHGHSWWDSPEETFEDVLIHAVEDGRFDVIMLPYNFYEPEMGDRVLTACKKKNIGTLAMKSNPIVIYEYFNDMKQEEEEKGNEVRERYLIAWEKFKKQTDQAAELFKKYGITGMEKIKEGAIQFILSNENMNTICCLFQNFEDAEKYIKLSGTRLDTATAALLDEFRSITHPLHCRIGCNICEQYCPHNLPINTIMRYNYYFLSKKQEKKAMDLFGELNLTNTNVCLGCDGYCEEACPYGVLTQPLVSVAQQNLRFTKSPLA